MSWRPSLEIVLVWKLIWAVDFSHYTLTSRVPLVNYTGDAWGGCNSSISRYFEIHDNKAHHLCDDF